MAGTGLCRGFRPNGRYKRFARLQVNAAALRGSSGRWTARWPRLPTLECPDPAILSLSESFFVLFKHIVEAADEGLARRMALDTRFLAFLAQGLLHGHSAQQASLALDRIARKAGAAGVAPVAAALAPLLASCKGAGRDRARKLLLGAPLSVPPAAVDAMELMAASGAAREAALRAQVAELEASPVNTRAANVDLAAAVRGGRGGKGGRRARGPIVWPLPSLPDA